MIRHFYSHILETESIVIELDKLELSREEKAHLIEIAEHNMHYAVMDTVLSELPDEDKKTVLSHMHAKKHEEIWKLLNKKIDNVEEKILKSAGRVKKELLADIKDLKK